MPSIDELIIGFDRGLRAIVGPPRAARPMPGASLAEAELTAQERRDAAALMRVNHCGEVCAQALYQGQALASQNEGLKQALGEAAREEADHLAWSEQRIAELGGRTSLLNPLWYAGAFGLGMLAGRLGDRASLGFVVETERQVEEHLASHLDRLPAADRRSRAIVDQMKDDERRHADAARAAGGIELPLPVRALMRAAAKLMTTTAHRI